MDDLNFARTSSRTVQSVRTSRRMARRSLNINTVATQVLLMSRLITLVRLEGLEPKKRPNDCVEPAQRARIFKGFR